MEIKETLIMPKGTFEMRGKLPEREPGYIEKCQQQGLYAQMLAKAPAAHPFYLHDGPPYANGDLHAGHGLNMVLKDIIIRAKTLEGFRCDFVPGWDTHGLPIENEITKSGVDRHKLTGAAFRSLCHDYALQQVDRQKKQALRLGLIGHFDQPYLTLDPAYEANEIAIFAQMFAKGLIYRGLKPVHWSPSSETAVAQADIEYKNLPATSLYVRFRIKKPRLDLREGDAFIIWTTTPWTLPANLAVCLNPDLEYGLYECDQGRLLFLKSLEDKLAVEMSLTHVKLKTVYQGRDLENIVCAHPFYDDKESLVILGKHVTAEEGTGCVHTAPGLGEDDYKVGLKYGLKPYCPVDSKGRLTTEAGPRLMGLFYEKANAIIIEMLQETGTLLKTQALVHSYPVDARNHQPLIFRTAPQWFCSLDPIRDKLIKACGKASYVPKWGKVRLRNMIEGRTDWCISRQRSWGVPIPIIYCQDGTPLTEVAIFNNIAKIVREHGSNIWYEKPAEYFLPAGYTNAHSPENKFTKETDIMDVWFDSGSSWLSVNKERNLPFPADLYLEGNDQYRGWYNASLILAVALTDTAPFKKIVTNGFIVDQNGQKFSKSRKNGIYPQAICADYGADIFRLWVASIDYTTAEIALSAETLRAASDQYRKIRNTFKFMLANLHDEANQAFVPDQTAYVLSVADKMILNKLQKVILQVKKGYDNYDFAAVSTALMNFLVNDLSSLYLDAAKDVLYCDEPASPRRQAIQYVMYKLTRTLAILYAPILFFTADEVYQNLPGSELSNVALESFPVAGDYDEKLTALYQEFLSLRNKTYKALEQARAAGLVKGVNEGVVKIGLQDGKLKELLTNIDQGFATYGSTPTKVSPQLFTESNEELTRLLGFAKVEYEADSTKIEVLKTAGQRCDRCWNYFAVLTDTPNGHFCPRCHKAYDRYVQTHKGQ